MSLLKIMAALGLPTKRRNGHDLGCICMHCQADREAEWQEIAERRRQGESGNTVIEILADEAEKKAP